MKVKGKSFLSFMLTFIMVATFCFGNMGAAVAEAESSLTTVKPAVVVTGDGIISDGTYSAANVSNEKSYSLDELKAIANADENAAADNQYTYSELNTSNSKSKLVGKGVRLDSLLGKSGLTNDDFSKVRIGLLSVDKVYETAFDPDKETVGDTSNARITQSLDKERYYYPNNVTTGNDGNEEGKVVVPSILAWEKGSDSSNLSTADCLAPIVGQLALNDFNNPLVNKNVNKITAGNALTETALTVGSETFTRADVLLMERADFSYTYSTTSGDKTDYTRGVPISVLLKDYEDSDVVNFSAADGYDVAASGKTKAELVENDYMLVYEKGTNAGDLAGVYDTKKNDASTYGFFTLYGNDADGKPAKMVNNISITPSSGIDFSTSPYKHITNGGLTGQDGPYDIDAITGATLTVEGPGVESSVPVSVRDLESKNAGAARANYTDVRSGTDTERTYEGIDLYYILHNMTTGASGIQLTEKASKVEIKNRNRQTIATFTLEQVEEAHNTQTPILVAYGTSDTAGTNIRPFVFDNATGEDTALGNGDGCLKLVYNKSSVTGDTNTDYTKFGNMAYIYVSEAEEPGYKHDKEPYNTAENSQYVLTVTGEEIGREVNYTVEQLENMVEYGADGLPVEGGMGYRDEYSLSNSNYWYVNEYEGVQLWKLLQKSGLSASKANDDETKVIFSATDGYTAFDSFSLRQIADPNQFGFYEKNPADDNLTYQGAAGDLKNTGYPVLVAYGVNRYPYVKSSTLDGYLSGLSNDGGPLRIISGKTEYKHANGSNQAKLLDKVIVGEDTYHYSTHKYHSNSVYTDLAESAGIDVKVLNGPDSTSPEMKNKTYKVGDIEELIYGKILSKEQLKVAKIKQFYEFSRGGTAYSDLYEGINLNYFLENVVELPGYKGTITFSNGTESVSLNLEDVLATDNGTNSTTGVSGLSPILAYGKNGAPMVTDSNSAGYEDKVTVGEGDYANQVTVKNKNGPLAVIFPKSDNSDVSGKSLDNVTSITINLAADSYAHTEAPYDTYAENKITVSGEGTKLLNAKEFTVADLEGKQTIAATGDYSIRNNGGTVTQQRYRGISLYSFLTSTAVGLKSNADQVTVTCGDGTSYTFPLSEVRKSDYINSVTSADDLKMILAYGSASVENQDKEDGKPLVTDDTSAGYDAAYGNTGGPLKLVVGQKDAEDINSTKILKNVTSITVSASEMTSWNHSSSEIFNQYLTDEVALQVVDEDNKEVYSKTYTVGELENMTALIERMEATTTSVNTWEGLNLWNFLQQELSDVKGADSPITINVYAKADNYYKDVVSVVGLDGLRNGIKDGADYKSVLLAYGMDEYPLASGGKGVPSGDGFNSIVGNDGGPIRLIVHGNQGACIMGVNKIVVKVGNQEPEVTGDFILNIDGKDYGYTLAELKDMQAATNTYGIKDGEDADELQDTVTAKGVLLEDLLKAKNIVHGETKITINTVDAFEDTAKGASYKDIKLSDAINQRYMVAYEVDGSPISDAIKGQDDAEPTKLRVYRDYTTEPTEWYNELKNVSGTTVTSPDFDFVVSVDGNKIGYLLQELKAKESVTENYTVKGGGTVSAKGVLLSDLLKDANVTNPYAKVSITTVDGYQPDHYKDITLKDIQSKKYMVAYQVDGTDITDEVKDSEDTTALRVYRNHTTDTTKWYNELKNVNGATASDYAVTFEVNGKTYSFTLAELKALKAQTATYKKKATEERATGVMLADLLTGIGVKYDNAIVNFKTYDSFEETAKGESLNNITFAQIKAQNYMIAYEVDGEAISDTVKDEIVTTKTRIYRNYTDDETSWLNVLSNVVTASVYDFESDVADGISLPLSGLRSIESDNEGGLWIGTYGGGLVHRKADGTQTVYNKASDAALATGYVSAVAVDKAGGVWFTQNASYEDPSKNAGICYMDASGTITQYTVEKNPGTIPDNYVQAIYIDHKSEGIEDDVVWFGSFGGLTKKDGNTWTTYTKTDGLPAESVNTIVPDNDGGLWIGCYPDFTDANTGPFTGGYAHMDADGDIKAYTAGTDETIDSGKLADVWVRSIAVDEDGGAWVVRSGSYTFLENVGGRIDYVAPDGKITRYTGKELLGSALTGNNEVRTVTLDADGGLWFGTSGDGLVYCKTISEVTRVFNVSNDSWQNNNSLNNIYCTEIIDGKMYVGSAGGLATADISGLMPAPSDEIVFTIKEGETVIGEFTMDQIKAIAAMEGDNTYKYSSYNTYPTWNENLQAKGPTVEMLLKCIGVELKNIDGDRQMTFVSEDGYKASFTKDQLFADRYYYPNGSEGTANGAIGGSEALEGKELTPVIINTEESFGQLTFGQINPNEQTGPGFIKYLFNGGSLVIGDTATKAEAVTKADVESGKLVDVGQEIKLTIPEAEKNPKIYYTIDGSEPTEKSTMYNYQAKQFGGAVNAPVFNKTGKVTMKVITTAYGKLESDVAAFTYDVVDRPAIIAELESYKNFDDYKPAQQESLKTRVKEAADAVNAATTKEELDAAVALAKANMDRVATASQIAAQELKLKKELAPAIIRAYKDDSEYRDEERAELYGIILTADNDVEAAITVDEINAIIKEAKAAMDKLKTDAQLTKEENIAAAKAKKVSSITAALYKNYKGVKVSWSKVSGVTGYRVYYKKYGTSTWSYADTTKTSWSKTMSYAGKRYDFKVKPYTTIDGVKYLGSSYSPSKYVYTMKTPTVKLAKSGSKAILVKWSNVTGETGYQIYRATSKNGKYSKVKTLSYKYSKWTDKNKKKGKTYYYKVRAYKKVGSSYIYTPFSSKKAIKR